jgi:hypothetical protein
MRPDKTCHSRPLGCSRGGFPRRKNWACYGRRVIVFSGRGNHVSIVGKTRVTAGWKNRTGNRHWSHGVLLQKLEKLSLVLFVQHFDFEDRRFDFLSLASLLGDRTIVFLDDKPWPIGTRYFNVDGIVGTNDTRSVALGSTSHGYRAASNRLGHGDVLMLDFVCDTLTKNETNKG